MTVRVRFAPSPTGFLHVGGARTALFNYLVARRAGGTFILRSDDTDAERSEDGFRQDIYEGMSWLGLDWDEGVERGGPHGDYRQSSRFDRYREVAMQLVADGHAYHSLVTNEALDVFRKEAQTSGRAPAYDGSLEPPADEAARRVELGEAAPIRFRVPRPGATGFADAVRGDMEFDHAQIEDFVILRSDGSPTYHLASTVDDVDYRITHVIRGEDLLSSTPKHVLITRAMGAEPPTYAHLSLLMGPDGKKLSKRHGDTALRAYRDAGIVPAAMVNYLALLGWSPGDDDTVITLGEMVERFDISAVSRNPAVFDPQKLEWLNGVYIRDMSHGEFGAMVRPLVEADLGRDLTPGESEQLAELVPLVQERAKRLTEVPEQVRFVFAADFEYDEASWDKVMTTDEAPLALSSSIAALEGVGEWVTPAIEQALRGMLERHELSARKGLQPLRVAVAGSSVSPPLFESMEVLGRERTLERLRAAADRL